MYTVENLGVVKKVNATIGKISAVSGTAVLLSVSH